MVIWRSSSGGILGDSKIFYVVLILFFLSSASWAFLAKGGVHGQTAVILCSVSLVITAICSIIFIAGAVEEDNPRWFVS